MGQRYASGVDGSQLDKGTTRRLFLSRSVAAATAPLLASATAPAPASTVLHCESQLLSAESAAGFAILLDQTGPRSATRLAIAPGVQTLSAADARNWCARVYAGLTLVLEAGLAYTEAHAAAELLQNLENGFGLRLAPPQSIFGLSEAASLQVRYQICETHLTRRFGAVTPLRGGYDHALATYQGQTVSASKQIGAGCLIYLGAMLGPNLFAEEREALRIGHILLTGERRS